MVIRQRKGVKGRERGVALMIQNGTWTSFRVSRAENPDCATAKNITGHRANGSLAWVAGTLPGDCSVPVLHHGCHQPLIIFGF